MHFRYISCAEVFRMEKKKLYIQTFGCQMNVQDSEKMATLLANAGYETTDDPAGRI